jgi:tetrahydromethanopterin S-methyltransferase subunit F
MERDEAIAIVEAIERVARSVESIEVQLIETNEKLSRGVSVDVTSVPPKEKK